MIRISWDEVDFNPYFDFKYPPQCFEFEPEEMCELLVAGIKAKQGNEYFGSMQEKARKVLDVLPVSDNY